MEGHRGRRAPRSCCFSPLGTRATRGLRPWAWEEVSHCPPITEQRLGSRLSVSKAKRASRRVCQEVETLTAQTGVTDAVVRAD